MRSYLYAKNNQGPCVFITTFLDKQEALGYAKRHAKLFKGVYKQYLVGSMADEFDKWTVWDNVEGL